MRSVTLTGCLIVALLRVPQEGLCPKMASNKERCWYYHLNCRKIYPRSW